jgi:hypothetical protein
MNDPISEAVERAAEYGGAPAKTFHVGPDAAIRLADGTGHLLTDATITNWSHGG